MNFLLDTHALLFAAFFPKKLGAEARKVLAEGENRVFVSVVTFWEISLKCSVGKLQLPDTSPTSLPRACERMGFEVVGVSPEDAASFHELPRLEHRDPFDRLLVWQAIRNSFALVSRDTKLRCYERHGLKLVW